MPPKKVTRAHGEGNVATAPSDRDFRERVRNRRAVMAAMASGDYFLARVALHRAHPMTPERVLRYAAVDLRAAGDPADKLSRRAMRIVEAVWLALRRGDAAILGKPDAWAGDYLEGQGVDERISAIRLLDKSEVHRVLVSEARRMRVAIEQWKGPVTASQAAQFVATFMPAALAQVAPEIMGSGLLSAGRYDAAKATIACEYERAWQNGKPLDDQRLARLALRAFSDSAVAGSYGKAQVMRRIRRKHRAAQR